MVQNPSSLPSVVDSVLQVIPSSANKLGPETKTLKAHRPKRKTRTAQKLELPRDRLAITFRDRREFSHLSLSKLAEASGIDVAHIWRIEQGEHQNVSRETLILLSLAMVLDAGTIEQVVEVANAILEAAGLKMLRAPWDTTSRSQ
jgi:hypothetical protein